MHLISVNIGKARDHMNGNRVERTGIYKEPSAAPVTIGTLGLTGDDVVDVENHGGVDQAVYVYGRADYDWWEAQTGRTFGGGMFGENLTIAGLGCQAFSIGDRLQVGAVVIEVTSPRIPCSTFATKMGDPEWVKKFRHGERPGMYCRVIQPGDAQAGDPVTYTPYTGATITLVEYYRAYYERKDLDEDTLRALLAAPIDVRGRREFESLLEKRMA